MATKLNVNEAAPAIDRAFMGFMESHKGGDVISEVSQALKQATAQTCLTGKASTVELKINIAPATKGSPGTLVTTTKVKTKLPEIEQAASIFYVNADMDLVREDPNQKMLPLREVATAVPATLKEIE